MRPRGGLPWGFHTPHLSHLGRAHAVERKELLRGAQQLIAVRQAAERMPWQALEFCGRLGGDPRHDHDARLDHLSVAWDARRRALPRLALAVPRLEVKDHVSTGGCPEAQLHL